MKKSSGSSLEPFAFHKLFKESFPELFCCGMIYHYTTKEAFLELVKPAAKLYATYFRALNDDEEHKLGFNYVINDYLPRKHKEYVALMKPFLENDDKWLSNEHPNGLLLDPWVMSFSRKRDSLYQWRSYTDVRNGGFALGFEFSELEKLVEVSVKSRRSRRDVDVHAFDYELHFLPCVYLDVADKKSKDCADKILDFIFENHYLNRIRDAEIEKKEVKGALLTICANLFAAITKNHSFADEKEVRLLMLVKSKFYYDSIEFVGGKPRLEIPFKCETHQAVESYVKDVTLSPHGDRCLLRSIADCAARRANLNYKILKSACPYNGR